MIPRKKSPCGLPFKATCDRVPLTGFTRNRTWDHSPRVLRAFVFPPPLQHRPQRTAFNSRVGKGRSPLPPHQTGRAEFPHTACPCDSAGGMRGAWTDPFQRPQTQGLQKPIGCLVAGDVEPSLAATLQVPVQTLVAPPVDLVKSSRRIAMPEVRTPADQVPIQFLDQHGEWLPALRPPDQFTQPPPQSRQRFLRGHPFR